VLYAILKPLAFVAARLLFRLEARGAHHVPRHGAVLLVANHSSVLDPPLVGSVTPRPVSFMAKAELFAVPILGRLIRALNARPVRRDGGDPAALRLSLRLLQEGQALLVFPEGTRGPEGTLRTAKAGAGMLAALSGAAVVPVYISGSGRALPRRARVPRPVKVRVVFGPALRFSAGNGAARKETYEAASRAMMAAIARLKDVAGPSGLGTSPREPGQGVGEVSMRGASASRQSTDGRNGQHGKG
jgi:1-acyl-sn-glycerol-3-phosphate acyltransferase